MPLVNYEREVERFIEFASDENVTAGERFLWYALMHLMHERAQGRVWPDDYIRLSNDRILAYMPGKYDTLAAARNRLKQRGLIDFKNGNRNKAVPAYKMRYFFPEKIESLEFDGTGYTEKSDNNGCYTEKSDNNSPKSGFCTEKTDNVGYNMGYNMGYNIGGNMGDIYPKDIYNNPKFLQYLSNLRNGNKGYGEEEEKEDVDNKEYIRTRARDEIKKAWRMNFNSDGTPAMFAALESRAVQWGFEEGVVALAIETAALKNLKSPMDYILSTLKDWHERGITTFDAACERIDTPYYER